MKAHGGEIKVETEEGKGTEFTLHQKVRTHWDTEKEQWYFSVIDVIEILTGSSIPKRYWSDLKKKLATEGNEVYEKIVRLKIPAEDGKRE